MIAATPAAIMPNQKTRRLPWPNCGWRYTANTSAPMAPIAPPSVGVASPINSVPSTRNINTAQGMMPIRHFLISGQPCSVRCSFGIAGNQSGLTRDNTNVYSMNSSTCRIDGPHAPRYMSPTDFPNWSARTTSTSDGGTSWVIVPEAASTPVAYFML